MTSLLAEDYILFGTFIIVPGDGRDYLASRMVSGQRNCHPSIMVNGTFKSLQKLNGWRDTVTWTMEYLALSRPFPVVTTGGFNGTNRWYLGPIKLGGLWTF